MTVQLGLRDGRHASSNQVSENSNVGYWKRIGTTTAISIGVALFDIGVNVKFAKKVAEYGFCLGGFLSQSTKSSIAHVVNHIAGLNNYASSFLGRNNLAGAIMAPALLEEIEFGWFLQRIVFRQLPKKILEKINPDLIKIVDSLPARITRIAAVTIIVALCHFQYLECEFGGGIYHLIGGLLYSTLTEATDSIVLSANLHIIHNLVVYFMNGGL